MPKFKGWWRGCGGRRLVESESYSRNSQPVGVFPCLSTLMLWMCPNLISIPPCPMLRNLHLRAFNERLHIEIGGPSYPSDSSSSASSSLRDCGNQGYDDVKLWWLDVDNVAFLKALPIGNFRCIANMSISFDMEVESLSEGVLEAVFCTCSSSLRCLRIRSCLKLRSVSEEGGGGRGLGHLTALESLSLEELDELFFEDEKDEMPWRSLGQSLRSLDLLVLPKMEKLPKGMRHLTSLHSLEIKNCDALEELPEWIGCLSSLQSLRIRGCPKMESCQTQCGISPPSPSLKYVSILQSSRKDAEAPTERTGPKFSTSPTFTLQRNITDVGFGINR